jgi:signal transduction histidine kinase
MIEKKRLQWILFSVGIIAVLTLTAVTVFSLFTLRKNSIANQRQAKKLQVSDFVDQIKHRLDKPFHKFYEINTTNLQRSFKNSKRFPQKATTILTRVSQDSLYKNIYYDPAGSGACINHKPIYRFNPQAQKFEATMDYPSLACRGIFLALTRMQSIITTYRFNYNSFFDAERSRNIALIDQRKNQVIGYLSIPIDQQYFINDYLQPLLKTTFGKQSNSGLTVWLRDWTNGHVVASSNPDAKFHYRRGEFSQPFHNIFENWKLYVSINETSLAATTKHVFWISLIVLIVAFIFLIGALFFIFITTRREQELVQRQNDFLANVTHELKTPVSVMQAAGENLADGRVQDPSRLQSYGDHIYSESIRLGRMIDNLLNVAKADASEFQINPELISLNETVQSFLEEHRSYITKTRGFTLKTSISDDVPKIKADKKSLETILENLLSNVIKYSREQKFMGIYLLTKKSEVILKVEDHGIGLSEAEKNQIFKKFYRVENSMTAKTKGHGLGLSIVKNLVSLNGGTIQVKSKKGEGSIFIINFPIIQENLNETESISSESSKSSFTEKSI